MDEKEKDIQELNEEPAEENSAPEQENNGEANTQPPQESEEGGSWQFDASAPMLENNIDIGGEYEINLTEETEVQQEETQQEETQTEEASQEYKEVSADSNGGIYEYKQEPLDDDDENEKVKRNFIVNKKAVKIAVIAAVCACALAVIAFFGVRLFLYPNSNEVMTPGNLALTVGDTKISVGYYNYYYNQTVETYLDEAQNGYNDLKVGVDYSQQFTTDDDGNEISWEQKFKDDTIWQIKYLTAYYEAALEAGVKLTDEQKETISKNIKSIQSNAAGENQSVKAYLEENVGEYVGINTMKTVYERLLVAQSYYYQTNIKLTASEDEIKASFDENKDDYKSISFALIELPYTEDDDINAVKAKADAYCKEIKSLTDMKNLIPVVSGSLIEQYIAYGYAKDEKEAIKAIADSMEHTFTADQFKDWFINDDISDWIYSEDTAVGSVAAFVDEDYSCIDLIYKITNSTLDETQYYSVRHILVMPGSDAEDEEESESNQTDKQTEYTEEEWAAALEKANAIVEEFNATDKSEMAFAELAEKYSEDVSSTSAAGYGYYGGEIFKTELGVMVPEFEAWSIDPSRQYGDVGIVKSKFGYHIMYFVYSGPTYMYSAKSDAESLKTDEFINGIAVTEHSALSKTTVATAESAD